MTSQEAKNKYSYHLTVGELKKQLEKYPDDALVVAQRVEDKYYEQHGWETINKPDPIYNYFHQYHPVWGVCNYNDNNCLFLNLHY